MRIKSFLISIILIFQVFLTSFLFLNNINNHINKNQNINIFNENDNPINFEVNKADNFFGLKIHITANKIENYYLDNIEVNCKYKNQNSIVSDVKTFVKVNLSQKTSIDIDDTLSLSAISVDEDSHFLLLNNELNKGTIFENSNYQYYFSLIENNQYSFQLNFHYLNINDQNLSPIDYNFSDFTTFQPMNVDNIADYTFVGGFIKMNNATNYINDWNNANFDYFYFTINSTWSSKILEDNIHIYKESYPGNGDYSIELNKNDYKIEYNEKTCQYSIYLKPYLNNNGDINNFFLSYDNEYIFNDYINEKKENINYSFELKNAFEIYNKNFKPEIKNKVTSIKKANKYENFNFNYSITIKNDLNKINEIVNSIYIAHSTNIEVPIDGFSKKYNFDETDFNKITYTIDGEFNFSINRTNKKQEFNDFVFVIKLNDDISSYSGTNTTIQSIDPFFVYPENNMLILTLIFILVLISIMILIFVYFVNFKKNDKFKSGKDEIEFNWN